MLISIIACIGENNELGFKNQLLWPLKEDLKNFKQITTGHHILMGRKTFDSIGRVLPHRTSLIISRTKTLSTHSDAFYFENIQEAFQFAKQRGEKELFVIGGAEIYKQALPFCHRLYLSRVHQKKEADAFFPDLNKTEWIEDKSAYKEFTANKSENTPSWSFHIYHRSA